MAYVEPTSANLKMRYSAFAAVDDATVDYWLTDAHRFVDQSWPIDTDYGPALIAVAAHNMMDASVASIVDSDFASLLANGVTDFQSGGREGFRAAFSPDAIKQALAGGYEATKPGQEYLRLLARNKAGTRVTSPGAVPCCNAGFNGFAGRIGGVAGYFEPC